MVFYKAFQQSSLPHYLMWVWLANLSIPRNVFDVSITFMNDNILVLVSVVALQHSKILRWPHENASRSFHDRSLSMFVDYLGLCVCTEYVCIQRTTYNVRC